MSRYILFLAALIGMLTHASLGMAEDIDIYATNGGTMNNPNILIILDNSSNWAAANQNWPTDTNPPVPCGNDCNKQGYYELKALRSLVLGLAANYGDASGNVPLNLGLMLFNNSNATRDGGYVRSAVIPMTVANQAALVAKLNQIISNFNTETAASSVQYGAILFDAFKYFGGYTNPANATTNQAPSTNPTYNGVHIFGTEFWGSNNADGTKPDSSAYIGINYEPVEAESCGRNYIVFIGNGFPAKDNVPSSDMGLVLRELTNPSNPPASITEFNLTTYTAGTTCSDVTTGAGSSCQTSSSCTTALTGYISGPSAAYTCNQSSCGNGKQKVQSCNAIPVSSAPSANAAGHYGDEYTNFLYKTDVNSLTGQQNVTTYTIDVFKDKPSADQSALMNNMAVYGGGKYYAASDLTGLTKTFQNILAEIQSVNSVFASSSLPVSVNTQGTYLNQVFMGMFRPDGAAKPRWAGNLKQYQLQFFNGVLRLTDKFGQLQAISATTGFITPCATSFWSTDTGTYWQFNAANSAGLCDVTTKFSDAPDGPVVEKGGAAQRLRGVTMSGGVLQTSTNYTTRALKTCDGSSTTSCTTFTNFNSSNAALTAAVLNVPTGTESTFIDWVRGRDVDNENTNFDASGNPFVNEMRPSVHGGVVHSQPAIVDFGGTTGVVAFYGADDGVLHAVNGHQGDTDGNEMWGFIAPESIPKLSRLRNNSPLISYPSVSSAITPTPQPKDYFFDGSISVYQNGSTVWIYPTMRRGGRAIYAFDVSTPSSPSIKWRKGCFTNLTTNDTSCTTGWSGIGQTWSKPQLGYLSGYVDASGNLKPVLVFGGGYDTCDDANAQSPCTGAIKGANIWFVDADTGTIIRTYPTNNSVPGDVTLLKDANTGVITQVYAADTGGYVYRVNVGGYDGTNFSGWTSPSLASNITIAALSETGNARKFLFGPDVVRYAGYNAVLVGSGDREHPLASTYQCQNFATTGGVQNEFFMIKDTPTAYPPSPITPSSLTDVTSSINATVNTITGQGWRFTLGRCEQVVNKALTVAGVVYFGTNTPAVQGSSDHTCGSNLGVANGYAVNFLTGASIIKDMGRSVTYDGGGLPPSPVAGIVQVGGVKVPFIIGGGRPDQASPSPLEGAKVDINPQGSRYRVYWYQESD